jgi:hypothetical protein
LGQSGTNDWDNHLAGRSCLSPLPSSVLSSKLSAECPAPAALVHGSCMAICGA